MPPVNRESPLLNKSLKALQYRIQRDGQECLSNANGMGNSGAYDVKIKKTIESSRALVIEILTTAMCDGVHSSSYRYAIAFEKMKGRQIDLNRIYNVGLRQEDHIFLRPELLASVIKSYRKANAGNPTCLAGAEWEDSLTEYAMTISPLADGGVALYYVAPDLEAACFPVLEIDRREVIPYRDVSSALEYGLP